MFPIFIIYWCLFDMMIIYRGGPRTAATSKMERFVIIVNGWKPLTIILKRSISDVTAVLDPSLLITFSRTTFALIQIRRLSYCVKSVRIPSYSGLHFFHIFPHSDWIRRNTGYLSVFSKNSGKYGKNADQNNSKYGHFLRSVKLLKILFALKY